MVTAKDEAVTGPAADGLHPAPIRLYAGCLRIVKTPAVHRYPKISVELEVGAPPVPAHCTEDLLQVFPDLGMRSIQRVPGRVTPSAECDFAGQQRLAVAAANEPLRVLLKDLRILFCDKRCNPDGRFESPSPNLLVHFDHISAERLAGLQPVSHRGLITVIDLHIFQLRQLLRNDVQVLQDLRTRYPGTKAIPRTPAGRHRPEDSLGMILGDAISELPKKFRPPVSLPDHELFEFPCFSGRQLQAFGVQHALDRTRVHEESSDETPA